MARSYLGLMSVMTARVTAAGRPAAMVPTAMVPTAGETAGETAAMVTTMPVLGAAMMTGALLRRDWLPGQGIRYP